MKNDTTIPHFSKKILFLSFIFLLISTAWYGLLLFSQDSNEYRVVAPRLVFDEDKDVQVKTSFDEDFYKVNSDYLVSSGSQIKTGDLSSVEIVLENNIIRLDENTQLTLLENYFIRQNELLPRLVFNLDYGNVWINAFDSIEVRVPRSSSSLTHSIASFTYSSTMNRIMVISGSVDLFLKNEDGEDLISYVIPLYNQVTYVDSQIVPDYAKLQQSKLKKELKLSSIPASVLDDPWIRTNTNVDLLKSSFGKDLIYSKVLYSIKNSYYKTRRFLTFAPRAEQTLLLDNIKLTFNYLLGGVHFNDDIDEANEILISLDDLLLKSIGNISVNQLVEETFFNIGLADYNSPAYLLKERLRDYIFDIKGAKFLRTYISDIKHELDTLSAENANTIASAWVEKWTSKNVKSNYIEFENQTRMLHRLILSYSAHVDTNLLDTLDSASELRLNVSDDNNEILFSVVEERLEIVGSLMSAYRYLDAKKYLKNAYNNLNVDSLDSKSLARIMFLQRANLLAQRIEYVQDELHGASVLINEEDFNEYIKKKTRDEILSNNLKEFLESDDNVTEDLDTPDIQDIVDRFADARISVISMDITPKQDYPFAFDIKNARLIDRTEDGSSVVFNASYNYVLNGVSDLNVNDNKISGSFKLDDLVVVLTKAIVPRETIVLDDDLFAYTNDDALRAQILAQDLSVQLTLNELVEFNVFIPDPSFVEILDQATLTRFRVSNAIMQNPNDLTTPIRISFDYHSSAKKASNIIIEDMNQSLSGSYYIPDMTKEILDLIIGKQKTNTLANTFASEIISDGFILEKETVSFKDADYNILYFEDIHLEKIPVITSGSYDLTAKVLNNAKHDLLDASDITLNDYFSQLSKLYIIEVLYKKGIDVKDEQLEINPPFDIIRIVDYKAGNTYFDFVFDISSNQLKDITVQSSGSVVKSMSLQEFSNIVQSAISRAEEDEVEQQPQMKRPVSDPVTTLDED